MSTRKPKSPVKRGKKLPPKPGRTPVMTEADKLNKPDIRSDHILLPPAKVFTPPGKKKT